MSYYCSEGFLWAEQDQSLSIHWTIVVVVKVLAECWSFCSHLKIDVTTRPFRFGCLHLSFTVPDWWSMMIHRWSCYLYVLCRIWWKPCGSSPTFCLLYYVCAIWRSIWWIFLWLWRCHSRVSLVESPRWPPHLPRQSLVLPLVEEKIESMGLGRLHGTRHQSSLALRSTIFTLT